MNKCASCDEILDSQSMVEYKAKCKGCEDLYCDNCYEAEAETTQNGEWKVLQCNCGEKIWRKDT